MGSGPSPRAGLYATVSPEAPLTHQMVPGGVSLLPSMVVSSAQLGLPTKTGKPLRGIPVGDRNISIILVHNVTAGE